LRLRAGLQSRGLAFAKWLMGRPEKHIAVVSHSGFLYNFFQNFGQGYDAQVAGNLHRHFNNCAPLTLVSWCRGVDGILNQSWNGTSAAHWNSVRLASCRLELQATAVGPCGRRCSHDRPIHCHIARMQAKCGRFCCPTCQARVADKPWARTRLHSLVETLWQIPQR
jgi:hypothetical protein